ncbi:Siderophore synthetase component [Pedobacter westerhofensis]|uniref:Siderophore synthetase component n=1 Tax=Pedobacter westerhofensis TaxID=425512 RepID=A0A521AWI7_9SPHI|nr:GNAT family N-acetyltransferase [Pedobacter westerhofensis]SMO39187.1 Siderophore synthetase component [Pedobacter westerhofensis]
METNIYSLTKLQQISEEINFNSLLNSYCREFNNWSRYIGIPKYDPALAAYLELTGRNLHLRFDFSELGSEVFVPLKHYAESGRHVFDFPAVERDLKTDDIHPIDAARFMRLIIGYAHEEFPDIHEELVMDRLLNSIENINVYLDYFNRTGKPLNKVKMNFIETEQSLALGHHAHPLPKGRMGFKNEDELLMYSPETAGQFQLAYFLIAPENVTERNAEGADITDVFRTQLQQYAAADQLSLSLLTQHPDWKVVPMHPWEAQYLLKTPEVRDMEVQGLLYDLGKWGPLYTPTSSVRTVYNRESDWMFKFSLHVKITNSERVNLLRELHRGYDVSRLLKTEMGALLKKDFPEIEFITDPAFITVSHKGKEINGFNTSIRHNVFKGEAADKNVTLLAALCQDAVLGQTPRIVNVILEAARQKNKPAEQVAVNWFKQYLHIAVGPIIGILNKYGMAFEFHQQNVLVELDSQSFPAKLYFRDNQGFFFREGKSAELLGYLPDLADQSGSIVPDEYILPKYTYYLLINNLMGIVNALGCNGLADERQLIDLVYLEFKQFEEMDTTGFVDYVINSRSWQVKGNLLTNLYNIDEASAPIDNPAIYRDYPNPLNRYFFCDNLIKPQTKETLYSRYFPKEDITITLRSFDIDRDLEMVHDWFNQEHAKPIWKMDGPIKELELFYRTLIPGDQSHSFIGEVNGEATFTMEPYWPMREPMGAYYDALPTDYGSHLLIAPTDKDKKYSFNCGQVLMDWVFLQPVVGKCIGEAAVESRAMHIFTTRLGFKYQRVLKMPHKDANLTFCYREWYWEKFPESKDVSMAGQMERV